MRTIGFRNSPSTIRMAVLSQAAGNVQLLNAASENRIPFPKQDLSLPDKLAWAKREIDRVLDQHKPLDAIIVKSNEYNRRGESFASREAAAIDSMVLLAAAERGVSVEARLYKQIATRSDKVKVDAEDQVGRTEKYWDTAMADAIMAALSALR
ncbi:MAG TPA: hypothetical protein VJ885_18360 [Thermoanaerobaculia bacterium]|jgi:hypothetical protein|nr:hypothetical protein [Thermoanaerobaculia bacterium]